MALSKKLLFVAIASIPFGIACNGILGLSDFQYGECPGARCGDAGFGDPETGLTDRDVPDTGPPIDSGPGAQPVSWANWRMPNYPGANGGTAMSYDGGTDGGVTDTVTGLIWRTEPLRDLTYDQAVTGCKGLAGGPWRLPKRIELVTLIDYSQTGAPFINTLFHLTSKDELWTSSEWRTLDGVQPAYWTIAFEKGQVEHQALATNSGTPNRFQALCVKDAP